jgi:hypothetical protein
MGRVLVVGLGTVAGVHVGLGYGRCPFGLAPGADLVSVPRDLRPNCLNWIRCPTLRESFQVLDGSDI